MAHFAELKAMTDPTGFTSDSHQVVQRVVVVGNDIPTAAGDGGQGGTGVVILRIPAANAPSDLAAAPGSNTITTLPAPAGGCKIATFTVSGTLTV